MISINDVKSIQFELTTRCQARCPLCPRNYRGYNYNSGYPITELKLQDFKKICTPELIAQLDVINFNGNLGDFGLASDALEIVQYLVEHNAKKITINTNGSMRTPQWWSQLALPNVQIGFALDGLEDTHSLYRQDTDWHTVIKNAQAFIDAGGYAVWRFIPFDHNQHQINACKRTAKEMGFTQFENIDEGRNRGPVYNRDGSFSHRIGTKFGNEPDMPNIQDLLNSHLTWFDKDTIQFEKDTLDCKIHCYAKRTSSIYVAADGSVYPCCWLGFYPGQMTHPGNTQLEQLAKENNALEYSLEHCLNWFTKVQESWEKDSIRNGRLYQCISTCGKL